jgi:hypothetical protein
MLARLAVDLLVLSVLLLLIGWAYDLTIGRGNVEVGRSLGAPSAPAAPGPFRRFLPAHLDLCADRRVTSQPWSFQVHSVAREGRCIR